MFSFVMGYSFVSIDSFVSLFNSCARFNYTSAQNKKEEVSSDLIISNWISLIHVSRFFILYVSNISPVTWILLLTQNSLQNSFELTRLLSSPRYIMLSESRLSVHLCSASLHY